MSGTGLRLVAGLGNPGAEYERTRHNIGFLVVDDLAGEYGVGISKTKFGCDFGRGRIGGADTVLAKPMTYMNRSGGPLRQLSGFFKVSLRDIVVVHDDIDLEFGKLKIKQKGGHGGHNGLRSIMDAFGGDDFVRVRIGIGRPVIGADVSNHVLGRFIDTENEALTDIVRTARQAVATVLRGDAKTAMNRFNKK